MSEMSIKSSNDYVKKLIRRPKSFRRSDFKPGTLLFYNYDAKDKTVTYDKTPLVLVLGVSKGYMLGLNFHWLPYQKRIWLIDHILKSQGSNIRRNNKIEFTYEDFKPLMKSVHYQPCIRLYISSRISPRGVVIPSSELKNAARLRSETFTNGKYSASQLYQMAKRSGQKIK